MHEKQLYFNTEVQKLYQGRSDENGLFSSRLEFLFPFFYCFKTKERKRLTVVELKIIV